MTEKYYIVRNEEFLRLVTFVREAKKARNKFICDFFKEHQIQGEYYSMHGNGS